MKELFFLLKKKTLANILHKLLSVIHSKKRSATTLSYLLSSHQIKEVFSFEIDVF